MASTRASTAKDSNDSSQDSHKNSSEAPGSKADAPQEVPAKGWLQIVKRGWQEAKVDQVPLLAAGVAFFTFLSIFPAIVALVLLYSLVADPATITQQIGTLTQNMPSEAASLIQTQIESVSQNQQQGFISLAIAIAVGLWSASNGMGKLITAINAAYDEEENRGFVKTKALALGLTLAAIVFMAVMITLIAVAPALLNAIFDSSLVRFAVGAAKWILIVVVLTVALAVLYRLAPNRDAPKVKWVSVGAGVATLLWVLASVGFTVYVSNFGSYAKTYGALAGVVILLLWLWITCYAVLLGAEINSESEQQTEKDTTKGEEQPMGKRDAVKADNAPPGE